MSNFIKEWTQKEVEMLTRSFQRYSVFVFILKFILPITALAMVGVLVVFPMLSGTRHKIVMVAQSAKTASLEKPIMTNPKFMGVDSRNQPYQIHAHRAIQQEVKIVDLEEVTADITMNDQKWVSVVAKRGHYDMDKKFVHLEGNVTVFIIDVDNLTYQINMSDADVDMDAGTIKTENGVTMHSEKGTFVAKTLLLEKEKQKITFHGGVKLVIVKK